MGVDYSANRGAPLGCHWKRRSGYPQVEYVSPDRLPSAQLQVRFDGWFSWVFHFSVHCICNAGPHPAVHITTTMTGPIEGKTAYDPTTFNLGFPASGHLGTTAPQTIPSAIRCRRPWRPRLVRVTTLMGAHFWPSGPNRFCLQQSLFCAWLLILFFFGTKFR